MKTSSSFATMRPWVVPFVALIFCTLSFTRQSSSQQQTSLVVPHPLITQPVDDSQLTVLKGNTHPLARPQFDLGAAPAALPMQRMLLVLKRSPEQRPKSLAALRSSTTASRRSDLISNSL